MSASSMQAPPPAAGRGFSFARALSLLALSALLAACAGTPMPSQTPVPTSTPAPTPTPSLTPATSPTSAGEPGSHYPMEIPDDEGTVITIPEQPARIVSLTPAMTEIVFALGAGDRMVGRGDFDDYPPEATELPGVAAFTGVTHEALVALEPDLVLAGGNNFTAATDIERMRELGLTVLVVYAESLPDVLGDIELVGRAIGAEAAAADLTAQIEARIDEVTDAVRDLDRPRTFYQIGSEPEIYAPAPDSFVADMVELAGGDPITTGDPAVFAIALERLVAGDPEVIILGDAQYGVCPADVAARPGWESITAVREGDIRVVYDTIVTRPGPRIGEGLAALALAIHPDAPIEPPAVEVELCPGSSP